jgi:hypothetical protein
MKADGGRRRGAETDIALAAQGAAQGSYTAKQGQYLAFVYYYTQIHGRSPSEADMQSLFPGFAALSPSDGPEPGEAGIHREDTGPGPLAQTAVAP